MKNFFAVCIIPLVVAWSATASAKEGIYITGKAGTSVVNVYGINSTFSQCSGSQKARTRSKKDATPCCVAFYVNYWPECSDLGYG